MLSFEKLERKTWNALNKHFFLYLPRTYQRSPLPVTVVMPLAAKDLIHARGTLEAWRKFLLHPVHELVVVGQADERIARFAQDAGARYVNEDDVLSPAAKNFVYIHEGRNRNGWIRQQLLKLHADLYTRTKDILVVDADTRPVRPISFRRNGLPILFTSHDFTPSYYACIERLLGDVKLYRRSFVAHCMLLEAEVLQQLRAELSRLSGLAWDEAILDRIDTSVDASFSEFELYGTFVYNRLPERFAPEYWFNCRLRTSETQKDFAPEASHARYNFVSRHVHLHMTKANS